jgi:uncharacterized metal-binding protein
MEENEMDQKPDTIILACSGASNTGAYSDKVCSASEPFGILGWI